MEIEWISNGKQKVLFLDLYLNLVGFMMSKVLYLIAFVKCSREKCVLLAYGNKKK